LGSFSGVKWSGHDINHSAPNAEVKNEWSCTSPYPMCLVAVDR